LEEQKLKILKENFGYSYKNGDELLFHCPKCKHHKRKLSVNIARNVFKCWVCEYSGADIYRLLKRYGSRQASIEWKQFGNVVEISNFDKLFETEQEESVKRVIDMPPGFVTLTGEITRTLLRPYRYLESRGLDKGDILRWKMGCCLFGDYENRVIIPSFDVNGDLDYFVARSYDGSYARYKNPPTSKDLVFNEMLIDWQKPIVLVEGVFDALNAENAIPLLGSTLNPRSNLFQSLVKKSKRVYVALDADAHEKSLRVVRNLLLYGMEVLRIDTSLFDDVGSMTKEEFLRLKNTASFASVDDYLLYKTNTIWS